MALKLTFIARCLGFRKNACFIGECSCEAMRMRRTVRGLAGRLCNK